MASVVERYTGRASLVDVGVQAVHACVLEVLEFLKANPVSAALLTRSLDAETYLAQHAGSVFYLSTLLGSVVREYVARERQRQSIAGSLQQNHVLDLVPLGLGAMFADVGMVPLKHLLTENRPLTPEERDAIRQHPIAGANMLASNFSPLAKMVVRTHHENYDGTGYPDGLERRKLHIFSRLVRIADAFDAATASNVFREAKSPVRVLWEMSQGPFRRFYDPALMKVFANLIQPFPIGAKLRMLDGRQAVVVRYNRTNSFEPFVLIAFDAEGKRLPDEQLTGPFQLNENHDLRVAAFGDEDLGYLYQSKAREAPPPPSEWETMLAASFP